MVKSFFPVWDCNLDTDSYVLAALLKEFAIFFLFKEYRFSFINFIVEEAISFALIIWIKWHLCSKTLIL